jgi:biotin carboxyl carrier protein
VGPEKRDSPPSLIIPGRLERREKLARETVEVPITGKVIAVNVKAGDKVKEDDVLCVLESMKMENPIVASVGGTVVEVGVKVDQVVKPGETVAVIEY